MYVWHTFHVFPETVFFLNSDDAELAISIGYHSFNTFNERVYDIEKADRYFHKALEIDPMASTAWHQLARTEFLRGNLNAALAKANKQIELHGDDFMAAYYVRGLIHAYSKNFAESEADFLKFLEWKKGSWAANNDLAWVYFQQGNYEKSEEYARLGLMYNKDNPWLLTMLGVSLLNLERREEARQVLAQALLEAENLTESNWITAYPGNDPLLATQGL